MTDATPATATPATPATAPVGTPAEGAAERDLLAAKTEIPKVETNLLAKAEAAKPEGETKTEPAKEEAKTEAKPEEPVKLKAEDYKFKVPEGLDAKDPAIGALAAVAAEHGIKPEVAQSIMDKVAPEIVKNLTAPYQAWKDTQESWQAQVKADPEIGGAKLDKEVLPAIAAFMDKHLDPSFREALEVTGAGNHPAMVKALWKLTNLTMEGKPVQGNPAQSRQSIAEKMYPTHSQPPKAA